MKEESNKPTLPTESNGENSMEVAETCLEGVLEKCTRDCPYRRILSLFGKKYTFTILRILAHGEAVRFNEIARLTKGSTKTVTERLSELVNYGLVKREPFAEIPPRVEYSLTEKGLDLKPALLLIREWGEKWNLFDC
jgi:DNA-binding HxlR family transcriptional regulator